MVDRRPAQTYTELGRGLDWEAPYSLGNERLHANTRPLKWLGTIVADRASLQGHFRLGRPDDVGLVCRIRPTIHILLDTRCQASRRSPQV
jgi:hypothetical protein